MPLQATSGAASYDAFGGGVPVEPVYIEQIFSTYLYTGNGSTQTITNGIDLSGKGGMVWTKSRTEGTWPHIIAGTNFSSVSNSLSTNNTSGIVANSDVTAWNSNGYTMDVNSGYMNYSGNFVSWTFRKQPKFFDVVTYTGNGTAGRTVAHNLASVAGCIIVKCLDAAESWNTYHRSLGNTKRLVLNSTSAEITTNEWNNTSPTSTVFTVGDNARVNQAGSTYVAYLFAHDAGGFGLTGTDNVISCGSFTADVNGNVSVTLGYEPQWVMVKRTSGVGDWLMFDTMRGMPTAAASGVFSATLLAQSSVVEDAAGGTIGVNATGFNSLNGYLASNNDYIYIAIRRGPMKVPTVGTDVFGMSARSGTGADATVTGGQTDDAVLIKNRGSAVASLFSSRLTGTGYLVTSSTAAEVAAGTTILQASPWDVMDGVKVGTTSTITNASSETFINYLFKRAPSFFDVVCGTADGSGVFSGNHNLTVVPEMVIRKSRSGSADSWQVWHTGLTSFTGYSVYLNDSVAQSSSNAASYTSTTFSSGANCYANTNQILYLFATASGVSKVGSYTGNGTTQTIDCGFGSGGARFVLIKRIDASGNWYTYDTARGMTVLTDPYWRMDISFAETATLGSVTTVSTGFALNATILAAINTNAASYIFLAIA